MQRPDESRELPSDLQLGPVCLLVSDLSRSLHFYGELLGLQAHRRADGTAVLGSIGGGHPLVELRERPDIARAPEGGRPGLYHFALLLPSRGELGRFVRHLAGRGIPIGAADHAVSEAVYLTDPDGLGIEVYADRPAEEWEYHRGQLRMGTRPLDLGALVSDAGPGEWEGFPHDTRMGHLHLHVADLDRAAEFYEEALGLSRTVWNYPGALFLAAGGYHHHLGLNTWATRTESAGEDEARLLHWSLRLSRPEALEAVRRRFEESGYSPDTTSGGIVIRDPWKTELRIDRSEEVGLVDSR